MLCLTLCWTRGDAVEVGLGGSYCPPSPLPLPGGALGFVLNPPQPWELCPRAGRVWGQPHTGVRLSPELTVSLLFWNLYPVVVLLLFWLLITAKICISDVDCHFFLWSLEAVLGHNVLVTWRTRVSDSMTDSTFSFQLLTFPLGLWMGIMSELWMMLSVAKYSFLKYP